MKDKVMELLNWVGNFIVARLKERTTWQGLLLVLGGTGAGVEAGVAHDLYTAVESLSTGVVGAGAISMVAKEVPGVLVNLTKDHDKTISKLDDKVYEIASALQEMQVKK